jgi:WD40 repeat protein
MNAVAMEATPPAGALDAQNPWPGLDAFDEAACDFFNGRDRESEHLLRLVVDAPLTVLFGKSGLGKTSLLRAGLFPRLRARHLLPVQVRLDIRADALTLGEQLRDALLAAAAADGAYAPGFAAGETLWEYLHRADLEIWSRHNHPLTPVFVIDQFEEVFTLGEKYPQMVERFQHELGDLAENRVPTLTAAAYADTALPARDFRRRGYKILICLREDFLPELEGWRHDLPSLGRIRMRLLPMSPEQALEAVHRTAPHLLDLDVARAIIAFVAQAQSTVQAQTDDTGQESGIPDPPTHDEANAPDQQQIEPALLSLFCRGLNEQRQRQGRTRFDHELLRGAAHSILSDHYRSSVLDMPDRARHFIEAELITRKGFRNSFPREDAIPGYLQQQELAQLIDRRILRVEDRFGTQRIELTHDLLTRAVREDRDLRRMENERQQAKAAGTRTRRRMLWISSIAAGCLALAVVAVIAATAADRAKLAALEARQRALAEARNAIASLELATERDKLAQRESASAKSAKEAAESALAVRKAAGSASQATLLLNSRLGEFPERGPLLAIAAYRLAPYRAERLALLNSIETFDRVRAIMPLSGAATGLRSADALAYSTNGKWLAAIEYPGRALNVWSADSATPISMVPQTLDARGIAFLGDGDTLAYGDVGRDGTELHFWDLKSKQVKRQPILLKGLNRFSAFTISPNGSFLFAHDGGIPRGYGPSGPRLWDLRNATPLQMPDGTELSPSAAAFSLDGRLLFVGDSSGKLWSLDLSTLKFTGEPIEVERAAAIIAVRDIDSGRHVWTLSQWGSVVMWDMRNGQPSAGTPSTNGLNMAGAISGIGSRFAVADGEGTIRVGTAESQGELPRIHKGLVTALAFAPDAAELASAGEDRSIIAWHAGDKRSFREPMRIGTAGETIRSLAVSDSRQFLIVARDDGRLDLWDLVRDREVITWAGEAVGDPRIAISGDGTRVVSVGARNQPILWQARTGRKLREFATEWNGPSIEAIAISRDGKRVGTMDSDGLLTVWNADSGAPDAQARVNMEQSWFASLTFSPDGTLVAIGTGNGTVQLMDSARLTARGPPLADSSRAVFAIAFSPDGKFLLSAGGDNLIHVWDVKAGIEVAALSGHNSAISSLAFSSDGKMLVSASDRGVMILWDFTERQPLGPPMQRQDRAASSGGTVVFGPGDKTLITSDAASGSKWDIDPESWIRKLCSKFSRNLSRREWREYVSAEAGSYRAQCPNLPVPKE